MRHVRGFSMIELLTILSIVSILVAMSSSSFSKIVAQQQMNSFHKTLIAALRFANRQATFLNEPVSLCPSTNKTSCNSGNKWQEGFISFIDRGSNGWNIGDQVIRAWNGQEALAVFNASAAPALIRYTPRGIVSDGGDTMIELCHTKGKTGRKRLSLSFILGRVTQGSSDQLGCI
jgi:type IV fimbrial biogenesis protein FimT